jgi:very-short-patch-repair endonuclease
LNAEGELNKNKNMNTYQNFEKLIDALAEPDMFYGAAPIIFEHAKRLRGEMTKAEQLLWEKISNKKINGLRFKRQHPIGPYIADFYCHKLRLVIEVDGPIHEVDEQHAYDMERTDYLGKQGIQVIRFSNTEVLNQTERVIETLKLYMSPL